VPPHLNQLFDVVYCLEGFDHLGEADVAAADLQRVMRPGGALLIAEEAGSGDLATDTADPMAVIGYASHLLYCMQDSVANGGAGLTASSGTAWIDDALASAGFRDFASRHTDTGFRLIGATS
jgi:hypothetical protein